MSGKTKKQPPDQGVVAFLLVTINQGKIVCYGSAFYIDTLYNFYGFVKLFFGFNIYYNRSIIFKILLFSLYYNFLISLIFLILSVASMVIVLLISV